jgi:hypothetical protein
MYKTSAGPTAMVGLGDSAKIYEISKTCQKQKIAVYKKNISCSNVDCWVWRFSKNIRNSCNISEGGFANEYRKRASTFQRNTKIRWRIFFTMEIHNY